MRWLSTGQLGEAKSRKSQPGSDARVYPQALSRVAEMAQGQKRSVMRLRIDTWDPEYGSSFDAAEIDDTASIARIVEDGEWAPIKPVIAGFPSRIGFLDGVRRIDVRLFAEDSAGIAPALAGSWAVGVAWADRPPAMGPVRLGRGL